MITIKRPLLLSACALSIIYAVWAYSRLESYCFFYPAIDTEFAPDFSEQAFDQVVIDMGSNEVQSLLGKPLSITINQDGVETWWFTADGKCKWGDFAWLGRSVNLSNNIVISTERRIYYD